MLGQSPQRLPGNQKCAISYRAPACLFCWFFLTGFYILLLAQHFALYRLKTGGAASPGTRSTTLLGRHWQQWGAAGGHPQQRGGVSPTAGDPSPQRGTPERSRQIWVHEGAPSGRGEPVRMFSQVITDPVAIPIQISPVGFIPFVLALVRKSEG